MFLEQPWVFESSFVDIVRDYNINYLLREEDITNGEIFSHNSYFIQGLKKDNEIIPIFKEINY